MVSKDERVGTFVGSVVLLVKASIGAAVLAMPHAFMNAGCVGGTVLLVILGLVTWGVLHVIHKATFKRPHVSSYEVLIRETLGDLPGLCAELTISSFKVLCICVFLVIVGDCFTPFAPGRSRFIAVVVGSLPGFFLSILPTMNQLTFFMGTGAGIVLIVAGMLIASAMTSDGVDHVRMMPEDWVRALGAMPIFVCSMEFHVAAVRVFSEMSPSLHQHADAITGIAVFLCVAVYTAVGYFGYRHFGDVAAGDILTNYHGSHFARILLVLNGCQATMGYAMNHFVARSAVHALLVRAGFIRGASADSTDPEEASLLLSPGKMQWRQRLLLTVTLYAIAVAAATRCRDLGALMTLIGATACMVVCFLLPAALLWSSSAAAPDEGSYLSKIGSAGLVLLGALCMAFGIRAVLVGG